MVTCVIFPIILSLPQFLERDPTCLASLSSNPRLLALLLPQHWGRLVTMCSPGLQPKSLCISQLTQGHGLGGYCLIDEFFIFLLPSQQLPLLFLLFSHDSPASELSVLSTSFSCSLLEETPSSFTKWADFCFQYFLLCIEMTDTSTGQFFSSAVVPDTGVGVAPVPHVLLSHPEAFLPPEDSI